MAQIKHGTLTADTVATVTLDSEADNIKEFIEGVEVLNRDGAAEIYFTVDGTVPTVGGDDCWVLPAAIGALAVPALVTRAPRTAHVVVKLISSGTPAYSVSPD